MLKSRFFTLEVRTPENITDDVKSIATRVEQVIKDGQCAYIKGSMVHESTFAVTPVPDYMVALTPNQLILLLQIYRGLYDEQRITTEDNTFSRDMRHLLKNGLIQYDGYHSVTSAGVNRVMAALEL